MGEGLEQPLIVRERSNEAYNRMITMMMEPRPPADASVVVSSFRSDGCFLGSLLDPRCVVVCFLGSLPDPRCSAQRSLEVRMEDATGGLSNGRLLDAGDGVTVDSVAVTCRNLCGPTSPSMPGRQAGRL